MRPAVLLDENLEEALPTEPILVGEAAKTRLEAAVHSDTAFLSSLGIMDYSLLAGVDKHSGELVVGIIDFIRQYTWDKQLETYVKASGVLGGSGKEPTVISPNQYKKRFRKAMSRYFVMVPAAMLPKFPETRAAAAAAGDADGVAGGGGQGGAAQADPGLKAPGFKV